MVNWHVLKAYDRKINELLLMAVKMVALTFRLTLLLEFRHLAHHISLLLEQHSLVLDEVLVLMEEVLLIVSMTRLLHCLTLRLVCNFDLANLWQVEFLEVI